MPGHESRNWGLCKLWFRTLPDLACTSVLERLAALSERKTMNDKLASLIHDNTTTRSIFIRVAVTVFVITLLVATAITFILPESYASTSRIFVRYVETPTNTANMDLRFARTQIDIINSPAVLSNVVASLHLNQKWGKKYSDGKRLEVMDAVELLKKQILITPIKNSSTTPLIDITAFSDDRNEAAAIANAMVDAYENYQMSVVRARGGFDTMNALLATARELSAEVKQLTKKVNALQDQFNINAEATEPKSAQEQPYWEAKHALAERADLLQQQNQKLAEFKKSRISDALKPGTVSNIQIIDKAVPSSEPARPNKPLNIAIGAVAGTLLASVIGALVVLLKFIRGHKPAAAA